MTKDELMRQVERWAEKAGATSARAGNYAHRAGLAFDQIADLSRIFADSFNKGGSRRVEVSQACIGKLVAAYSRSLINFKIEHGIPAEACPQY